MCKGLDCAINEEPFLFLGKVNSVTITVDCADEYLKVIDKDVLAGTLTFSDVTDICVYKIVIALVASTL